MKTIYLRKLKSGNYELSNKKDATEKFNTKKALKEFFESLKNKTTNVWDRHYQEFKPCRIVKAKYSQTQTYFESFTELYNYIKKTTKC